MTGLRRRADGRPLVMITAYDHSGARLAERAGVDLILVGDSAGMVVLGQEDTTTITLDQMVTFASAVSRGATRTPVIGDLPYGTYEANDDLAVQSARRMTREGGARLVKLEGGGPMVDRVRAVTQAGMPVMGHLGLLPQSIHQMGGYRAQATRASDAVTLLEQAQALELAGAVALVLEAIPPEVAAAVTATLTIPTIGIGAGPLVDGQVLVWHDVLGLTEGRLPRFAKPYAALHRTIVDAIQAFAADVREGAYPAPEHSYAMSPQEQEAFQLARRRLPQTGGKGGPDPQ